MLNQSDYEEMQSNPDEYFRKMNEMFANELKGVREQTRALKDLKALLESKLTGAPLKGLLSKLTVAALKSSGGLDKNIETTMQKQEALRQVGDEYGQIYSNALLNGQQNKELDRLMQTIKQLDGAYTKYLDSCLETRPVLDKLH